jgi:hypothetical protein
MYLNHDSDIDYIASCIKDFQIIGFVLYSSMQTTESVWNCQLVDVSFSSHFLSLVKKGVALELIFYVHQITFLPSFDKLYSIRGCLMLHRVLQHLNCPCIVTTII